MLKAGFYEQVARNNCCKARIIDVVFVCRIIDGFLFSSEVRRSLSLLVLGPVSESFESRKGGNLLLRL